MNENNNRVTAPLTTGVMTTANTALDTFEAIFANLESLTLEEREALPKINVANRVFVNHAINLMNTPTAAAFIPAYLEPAAAAADLEAYVQMEQLISRLDIIRAMLDGHRVLAGSEAYTTSLAFFKIAQAAAAAGAHGAQAIVDELKERFAGQGGGAPLQQQP
jgi:hypothetical protein